MPAKSRNADADAGHADVRGGRDGRRYPSPRQDQGADERSHEHKGLHAVGAEPAEREDIPGDLN